jgi:hypothetical protein
MATEQNNTAPSVSDVEIVDVPHSESSEQESSAEETTTQPFSSQSSPLCGEAPSSPCSPGRGPPARILPEDYETQEDFHYAMLMDRIHMNALTMRGHTPTAAEADEVSNQFKHWLHELYDSDEEDREFDEVKLLRKQWKAGLPSVEISRRCLCSRTRRPRSNRG